MLSRPFRSPLLKRLPGDENDEHVSKKLKGEPVVTGPRLVFKHPGISTLPRKPLLEFDKPAAEANGATSKGFYSALWRNVTSKKNKTWEGDAVLLIDPDGLAELHERETGKLIGRSRCNQPLLPGSTLLIAGKDVEVDSVLSKAQYHDWKQASTAKKPKEGLAAGKKRSTENQSTVEEIKKGQDDIHVSVKPISNRKQSLRTIPTAAAPAQVKRDPPRFAEVKSAAHREISMVPFPRHSPNAPNALVMKRPDAAKVDVVVDPLLSGRLRPHQREGVKFMYDCVMGLRAFPGHGAILADEMGLGKTLQTITLLWTLLKQSPYGTKSVIKKALIVCPATLINNWRKEFRKWLGLDRLGVLVADGKSRVRDFTHGNSYSIMIVGYEKLRNIQVELSKGQDVDLIVADEAHRLKTAKNKSAAAINAFPTERRIFLTGTPVQNDLSELYVLVNTVNPGSLGNIKAFTRDFEVPINRGRQPGAPSAEVEEGEDCNKELIRRTSPFILRRTANVLASYLPAKTEYIIFCKPTETQKALYRHLTDSQTFRAAASGKSDCPLQLITLLKKACNSPSLLSPRKSQEDLPDMSIKSAALPADIPPHLLLNNAASKLRMLDNLLHTLRTTTDEKVVLVSNYTSTLDLLSQLLTSVGCTFSRMDGSTPSTKRQGIIDDFNRSSVEHRFAFLLSAKTGGVGINLVGASRLVLFDVDWNPATDLQAMARIHRDGQKRGCFIYRFLMAGGIDEKIFQRQVVKLNLAGSVMDQKMETSSFTREELKDLFRLDETLGCQTHDLIRCKCGGRGSDFIDIDDYPASDELPGIPALLDEDNEEQQAETKAAAHAARDVLMAYTHVDTSKFATGVSEGHENLIEDDVLLKTLKEEGNRISFVFSRTSA
ncbi:MAG: hypothetical protein LQ343_000868 [Gyalolechia ehrenbergii]|nr:MAG: hypothetical protein LQ343_000868 [Gyalolechia ehrenbergii]